MADLQDLAPLRGEADQLAGIRHRCGDRLLDQDMGAMLDEIPGDPKWLAGGVAMLTASTRPRSGR